MNKVEQDEIRRAVREQYAGAAMAETSCCGTPSCCGSSNADELSAVLGYSAEELGRAPEGANLGLGCGNPQAIAALKPGETVLDLGSGAGFDSFLAAAQVGPTGKVLGVDMTPEMISKARGNAEKGGYANVDFRLGEIEHLPVQDRSVDVILSNCVINLSPDKVGVFAEAFRVLKPGGRLAISDVVAFADLPDEIRRDMSLYTGCMAGASSVEEIERMLKASGFAEIRIARKDESKSFIRDWAPGVPITDYVVSATIEAVRPGKQARDEEEAPQILLSTGEGAFRRAEIKKPH